MMAKHSKGSGSSPEIFIVSRRSGLFEGAPQTACQQYGTALIITTANQFGNKLKRNRPCHV
eukprot:scaffold43625_cov17-Prasinocladus_malaysianus.AAC.2